jgi:hypothetical protein
MLYPQCPQKKTTKNTQIQLEIRERVKHLAKRYAPTDTSPPPTARDRKETDTDEKENGSITRYM